MIKNQQSKNVNSVCQNSQKVILIQKKLNLQEHDREMGKNNMMIFHLIAMSIYKFSVKLVEL